MKKIVLVINFMIISLSAMGSKFPHRHHLKMNRNLCARDILKRLPQYLKIMNPNLTFISGSSLLMEAVKMHQVKNIKKLLKCPGIRINTLDKLGKTALDAAYEINNKSLIALLRSRGAMRGIELIPDLEQLSPIELQDRILLRGLPRKHSVPKEREKSLEELLSAADASPESPPLDESEISRWFNQFETMCHQNDDSTQVQVEANLQQ